MTVYVDVLLLENIAINLVILGMTAYFSRIKIGGLRLLLGASIGALGVFIAFIPGFDFNLFFKIIFSFAMIAITFWPNRLKDFLKQIVVFYFVCFAFGGAAFALFYFLKTDPIFYNGAFYINHYPFKVLIISSVVAYVVIMLSWNFVRSRITKENLITEVIVKIKDKAISLKAFVDTGNSLKDPISQLPVVVVEYNAIKGILPDELCEVFGQDNKDEFEVISRVLADSHWMSRFRIIPFKSLGKENGMLLGFKPDGFFVSDEENKNDLKDVIIGIYNKSLSQDKTYEALIAIELLPSYE